MCLGLFDVSSEVKSQGGENLSDLTHIGEGMLELQ